MNYMIGKIILSRLSSLLSQKRFTIGEITYEITGIDTVKVYRCNSSATSVNIPSTVTNRKKIYNITSIENGAFNGCIELKTLNFNVIECDDFYQIVKCLKGGFNNE